MFKRLKLMFYNSYKLSYHLLLRTFHLRKNKDLDFTAEPILETLHLIKAFVYLSYEKLLLKTNARKCKNGFCYRHFT